MVEITYQGIITAEEVEAIASEDLELYIENKVAEGIKQEIEKHIEEMSFIDMEVNASTGNFEITAELVLCSKGDIVNSLQMQSVKLAAYGLNEDQILDVLETQAEPSEGF